MNDGASGFHGQRSVPSVERSMAVAKVMICLMLTTLSRSLSSETKEPYLQALSLGTVEGESQHL